MELHKSIVEGLISATEVHNPYLWSSIMLNMAPRNYSTPEGRAAEGGTPAGRAVSVTRELDLSYAGFDCLAAILCH